VLWIFVAGGIIDRYARDRAMRAPGFFAGAGGFFFRFLRLAAVQWIVYAVLFGALHPWLFNTLFPRFTREMTVERNAFAVPPVDTSSHPSAARRVANSTMPVLSETLISARLIFTSSWF
jgi:hypothetical protein